MISVNVTRKRTRVRAVSRMFTRAPAAPRAPRAPSGRAGGSREGWARARGRRRQGSRPLRRSGAMSFQPISPRRKRSTAISSAADRPTIAPALPVRAVSSTAASAGYRWRSGAPAKRSVRATSQSRRRAGEGRCSQRSAYWMGSRMSGSASCAFTLPSTYSTSACTTLSG